jgi:uncharacterized protein YggE
MKKENNAIVITSIIAGVVLLIAILALTTFTSVISPSENSVTVQGISTIKAMPDVISVYITIETKGATSSEATTANTQIYGDLVEEMIIAGFSEDDLATESFSVYENTYWEDGKQKTDGYIASHYLKVELLSEKMSKVSSIVDAGINSGAEISYINFELSQVSQNKYKAEALKSASEDAMVKAEAIASGFNKEVGKLLSVQTSDFGYYPWNVYTASGSAKAEEDTLARQTAITIQPGEEEITATITATFRLK